MPTTNPVPSTDPSDLLFNAGKLDEVVNSTAPTYTDRMGVERRTLTALEDEFPNAAANAAAAAASAVDAAEATQIAQDEAAVAISQASAADASRVAAEAARDAAQLSAGVYATTAAGLAATTNGQYFSVPSSSSSEYLILYLNSSGTAVEQKRYPSIAGVGALSVSEINKALVANRNLFNPSAITDGNLVLSGTGGLQAIGGYFATDFLPVVGGGSLVSTQASYGNSTWGYAFYDAAKSYLSGSNVPLVANTAISVPAGAVFIRITYNLITPAQKNTLVIANVATAPTAYAQHGFIDRMTSRDEFAANIAKYVDDKLNLFNKGAILDGQCFYIGNLVSIPGTFTTDYIPVVQGGTFTSNTSQNASNDYSGFFYDINKVKLASCGAVTANTPISIPFGAAFVRFSVIGGQPIKDSMVVVQGSTLPTTYKPFGLAPSNVGSQWAGKKLFVSGDSISTYGYGGEWKTTVTAALSCILQVDHSYSGYKISQALSGLSAADFANVDFGAVLLGTNDYGGSTTFGSMTDTAASATFYGYVKNVIETVLTWKPTCRLVFFTPIPRSDQNTVNAVGKKLVDYVDAIREVCAAYSIPVLDLYRTSGLNTKTFATYATDGVHLNSTGAVACIGTPAVRFFTAL